MLVPMIDCDAGPRFDISAMISAVTERTKVVFVCTPNNPTGNRLEEAALRRLLRLGLPPVIDEAYYELGETPDSLAYLLGEFPNAIILRTFSKAFGLAGLRIGYTLAHPAVIRLLARVKLPWNVSTLTIAAASAALDDIAEQDDRVHRLREGRAWLTRELGRVPGVSTLPSQGNFVVLDLAGCGVSSEAVAAAMLERGVFVRTLTVHHAGRGLLRITVGTADQNARCVDVLRQALSAVRPEARTPRPTWVQPSSPGDAE